MSETTTSPVFVVTGSSSAEENEAVAFENSSNSSSGGKSLCIKPLEPAVTKDHSSPKDDDDAIETINSLESAISDNLETRRQALLERYRSLRKEAAAKVQQLVDAFGLTADDVRLSKTNDQNLNADASKTREDACRRLPVKYRGPHGETWSGRGKVPIWMRRELERGARKKDFFVEDK